MKQIMEDSLMLEFSPDEDSAFNFDDPGKDSFLWSGESDDQLSKDTAHGEDIDKLLDDAPDDFVHFCDENEKNIKKLLDKESDLSLLADMDVSLMHEFSPEEKITLGKYDVDKPDNETDKSDDQMSHDTDKDEDIRKLLDDSADDFVQFYIENDENIGELLDNKTDCSPLIELEQMMEDSLMLEFIADEDNTLGKYDMNQTMILSCCLMEMMTK